MYKQLVIAALVIFSSSASAVGVGVGSGDSRYFWGGGLGASFGEVDVITVSPMLGVNLTEKLSTGVSLTYIHRSDSRNNRKIETDDFGTTLFSRYNLTPQFFLEADYEFLSTEYQLSNSSTERRDFNSFMAGGGMRSPLGGNASAYFSALYNFSYDDEDSPYDDPWVVRGGIGFGF